MYFSEELGEQNLQRDAQRFALQSHFKMMVNVQNSSKCNKIFHFGRYKEWVKTIFKSQNTSYINHFFFPTCRIWGCFVVLLNCICLWLWFSVIAFLLEFLL